MPPFPEEETETQRSNLLKITSLVSREAGILTKMVWFQCLELLVPMGKPRLAN